MGARAGTRLKEMPVAFFTCVMGLAGLTLALHAAFRGIGIKSAIPAVSYWFSVVSYIVISILYMAKFMLYPAAVRREWNDPESIPLFPAISFSVLLIAIASLNDFPAAAHVIWLVGAVTQALLTFAVVTSWIGHREFKHPHLSPAWFIPVVGNMLVPIAGAPLGYPEISWLFFSMGLMLWLVLLVLVVNRLIFHEPLPDRLRPTLVIMIAPPAIAFLGYMQLVDRVDPTAHMLLDIAYIFALIVITQIPQFMRLHFMMSFWALSFPVASLTVASFKYAALTQSRPHFLIGFGLLAVLVAVIVALVVRTFIALLRNEICAAK